MIGSAPIFEVAHGLGMGSLNARTPLRRVGRYAIFDVIAAGGMAQVHVGRLLGPVGFSRTVAIKRMHAQLVLDAEFVAMFVDEARLAARIRHPNVVSTLDVLAEDGEVFVVMDYVHGESLSRLSKASGSAPIPPRIAVSIAASLLTGLHAAHEAKGEDGKPLSIVHRDVSPQNVIVDVDGAVRVLDFGIAKAASNSHATKDGQIKGKEAYMAPEQMRAGRIDRRVDVFASGVVLWEMLTGQRLFLGDNPAQTMMAVLEGEVAPPSSLVPDIPPALDAVILKALAKDPDQRFSSARDMAIALEAALVPATAREISAWLDAVGGADLAKRAARIEEIERGAATDSLDAAGGNADGFDSQVKTTAGRNESASGAASAISGIDESVRTGTNLETSTPRAAKRSTSVALGLAGLVVGGGLIFFFSARGSGSASIPPVARDAVPVSSSLPSPSSVASAVPSASDVATTTAPSASSERAALAAPSASAAITSASTPKRGSARPSLSPSAPSASALAKCTPNYTIDELGVKHFKPECL